MDAGRAMPQTTWYANAMAHGDSGVNVTHFWSKGSKFRAETVIAGHKIVTIVRGEHYYAYDGNLGKGIDIRRTSAAIQKDSDRPRPFGLELDALMAQGAEKVGSQRLHGAEAHVYRLTDVRGRREVWVSAGAQQLPMRAIIFQRGTGKTQTTDYLNWLSNIAIDDDFFEPAPHIQFVRKDYKEYMDLTAAQGVVGPVPVLYGDLLHGNSLKLQ